MAMQGSLTRSPCPLVSQNSFTPFRVSVQWTNTGPLPLLDIVSLKMLM
jgi:hypothetical protein